MISNQPTKPTRRGINLDKPWEKSLTTRLVISFLLVSLIVVILLGIVAYLHATTMLQESVYDQLESDASVKIDWLNNWINEQIQNIVLIAWLPGVREQVTILSTNSQKDPAYQEAYSELSVS